MTVVTLGGSADRQREAQVAALVPAGTFGIGEAVGDAVGIGVTSARGKAAQPQSALVTEGARLSNASKIGIGADEEAGLGVVFNGSRAALGIFVALEVRGALEGARVVHAGVVGDALRGVALGRATSVSLDVAAHTEPNPGIVLGWFA